MIGDNKIYELLEKLNINFEYYEHPPVPTVEEAKKYWRGENVMHCKNIFVRNHKGNQHYLIVLEHSKKVVIKELENMLQQGKLSFASEKRLQKYLNVKPGSVSLLGIVHDNESHVVLFLDKDMEKFERISFHPNDCTATLSIAYNNIMQIIEYLGNRYQVIDL